MRYFLWQNVVLMMYSYNYVRLHLNSHSILGWEFFYQKDLNPLCIMMMLWVVIQDIQQGLSLESHSKWATNFLFHSISCM